MLLYQRIKFLRKNCASKALLKKSNFATLFETYFNKIIHIFAMSKRPYYVR